MNLDISIEEFSHRYRNSIVGLVNEDSVIPVRIDVTRREGDISLWDFTSSPSDGECIHTNIAAIELVLEHPPVGMLNVGNSVMYLTRFGTSNAYKRGVMPNTIESWNPVTRRQKGICNATLNSLYSNVYIAFDEAADTVTSGDRVAAAITADFAIVKSRDYVLPLIYYGKAVVGYCDGNNVYIHPDLDFVQWELSQLTSRRIQNATKRG